MWLCRTCWLTGPGPEDSAVGEHLKLIQSNEIRVAADFRTGFEKFTGGPHTPDLIFGGSAIRKARIKREPGPTLDLDGSGPLRIA